MVLRLRKLILTLVFAVPLVGGSGTRGADWLQFARNDARQATTSGGPASIDATLWVAGEHPAGVPLAFEGHSSPVSTGGRVYANARLYDGTTHINNRLVCFDSTTGAVLFATPIAKSYVDSWSSPAVDALRGTVLLGSGSALHAVDAQIGGIVWVTPLARPIVNASVCVAEGLEPGRALITDYTGFASGGSLYCINTSAFDATVNPYTPGDIVWTEPLGVTSGNSPAFKDGVVYVASSTGVYPSFTGRIRAFDIDAPDGNRLLWEWSAPLAATEVFYGGVTWVAGHVYAATYNFSGSGDTARLVKIDATSGTGVWSVACNRTVSTPVVSGTRIYLSTGIPGFGSAPRVQAFDDLGASAVKTWDTYADTGGALIVGGWTHQPVLAEGVLYAGKISTSSSLIEPYTDLFMLDVSRSPAEPGFEIAQRPGLGSSPAVTDGRLYSIGATGLHAVAALGDLCGTDGRVNGLDVQCFVSALLGGSPTPQEIAMGDFDGDGQIDFDDVDGFVQRLMGM